MSVYHDEVEIEDMEYDEEEEVYYYPCPCGDRFQITKVIVKIFWGILRIVNISVFLRKNLWRAKKWPLARVVHSLLK